MLKSLLSRLFAPQHGAMLLAAIAVSAIVCAGIFVALQQLPPRARTTLIKASTFLAGLFYALEWIWPVDLATHKNPLTFAVPTVGNILNVLVGFTLILGIVSLLRVHGTNVIRRRSGWENSLILLVAMVTMAVLGIGPGENSARFPWLSVIYRSLFQDLLANFDAAMFASLAFFIIGAAYRAFRIKSVEATLLMMSALVVMLGQIPIGQWLTSSLPQRGSYLSLLRLDNISTWLLTNVNAPAIRAISFGLGIGLLAIGLRVWLSLERGAFFDQKAEG